MRHDVHQARQGSAVDALPSGEGAGRPSLVLTAAMMGVVLVSLDVSVVNVALDAFRRAFAVRLDGLQWVLNVYTLTYAVLLLSAGALSDRLGSRTVFMVGSAVFTSASLLCGLAPSFAVLLAARTVQGVGAALLVPSSMALLQQTFPDAKARARAVGLWAGAGSLAIAGGPVLGGALIAYVGWRGIFLINLPFGLLGSWLALNHAPRPVPTNKTGFDLPGQFVAVLALALVVGALTETSAFGWGSSWIAAALSVGVVLFVGFIIVEARSARPMMPLGIFRDPTFAAATWVGVVANFAFYGLIFVFSLFFQAVQHRSALATGLAFVPMTGVLLFVNILAGRLIGRNGIRPVMLLGLCTTTIGYGSMLFIGAATPATVIAPAFALAGTGMGLAVPAVMTASVAGSGPGRAGIAAGVLNAARQVGGAAGVALFGSAIVAAGPADFVRGLHLSIAVACAALVSALLVAAAFVSRSGSDSPRHLTASVRRGAGRIA